MKPEPKLALILVVAAFCMHARIARSEVRVPAVFTDHMVLQREMKLPIWGWADPGETVSVSFLNQHKSVIADSAGRWRVLLDPVPASATPEVLTIAGRNTVSVSDVLVGDVWICSGQSNMQLRLKASSNASVDVPAANRPLIHLLQVEHIARAEEQDDIRGQWTACSPKTAADFSAVGYYFGRDLQDVIKVPVGLIHSSWAGSIAEVWTPPESLQGNPILAPILSRYQDAIRVLGPKMEKYRQAYAIWASKAFPQDPGNTGLTDGWASQDYNDSGWTSTDVPVEWSEVPGINVVGMVWFRGTIDVPTEMAGRDLILSLGSIAHCDMTYFNGQQVGSTWVDVPDARQVQRRYKVPGSMVHVGKNVIAIRAFNITGIGAISGPAAEMYIAPENDSATRHRLPVAGKWKCKLEHKLEQNNNPPPKPERPLGPDNPTAPSNLFNGMIKPIIPFAIKGVIWYQGEGNGGRGYQYRTLLPALIQGWRARWHEGDFPFLIVQLPNFSNPSSQPVTNEPWPALREAQLFTVRSVPATGLAVTIDIGERQVHPGNKKDVGHRLALAALDVAYHLNGPSTGPLYLSCRADGDHISITFDHIGSGLTMRKGMNSLAGFAIAGFDRKFVAADARIVGDTVVVRSAAIPSPAAVRYLWANNPSASLFNLDGLPASPFRTDDWPIATQDAR